MTKRPNPAPNTVVNQVTGVILSGGRATRMGGVDKGLIPVNGKPMISWVIDVLRPQVGEVHGDGTRSQEGALDHAQAG